MLTNADLHFQLSRRQWVDFTDNYEAASTKLYTELERHGKVTETLASPIASITLRSKSIELLSTPSLPFAWIDIPGTKGKTWKGEPYAIAKYPVTNAQYIRFIEAGGYEHQSWWTTEGWKCRQSENWTQPRYWTDVKWNHAEQPVVGVSWFESLAFCLWISQMVGESIMLATEEQWQYAAQGDYGQNYPWGNDWNCKKCNNSAFPCHSKGTTPVKHYEGKGDSYFGVVGMAGNVWEWCLTAMDGENNGVNATVNARMLRGGSWGNDSVDYFRVSHRGWNGPDVRNEIIGFRIVRLDPNP